MFLINTTYYNSLVSFHHFQGTFGKFKKVEINGKLIEIPFDEHFLDDWIVDEIKYFDEKNEMYRITGPISCYRCRKNGIWNGVIIGYCNVCAEIHELERGLGLFGYITDKGIPYEADHCIQTNLFGSNIYKYPKEKSMWNTYFKNVDMSLVGDTDLKEKYKDGYFSDKKEEKVKGYYCDRELY
jgi:hypothetical protein